MLVVAAPPQPLPSPIMSRDDHKCGYDDDGPWEPTLIANPLFEWEPPLAPGHAGLDLRPEHLGVPARRKGLAALPPVGLGPADLVDEAGDLASAVRPNQLEVMRAALRTLGETVSDMGRARSLPGSVGASNYSHTRLATLRVEPSSALGRHQ